MGGETPGPALLSIASLTFEISSPDLPLITPEDPAYESFTTYDGEGSESELIPVRLEIGEMPPLEGLEKIFDTDLSWSARSDGRDLFLALQPPAAGDRPHCLAVISFSRREVEVFFGGTLVMETEGSRSVENPVRYPLDQLLLIHLLSGRGALIHAAGTILEDKGYIFAGTSGSGKSTLAGLMSERQGYSLLSDDRVVAGEESGELTVYGTPWPGEAGMAENRKAPLERIFILEHGRVNRIRELSAPEILEKLLPAVSVPWYHQVSLSGTLDFLNTLIQRTPVCVMEFNPDEGAVRHLEEYLSA